jgi:hypoxanthine phosphoribosyltransferase
MSGAMRTQPTLPADAELVYTAAEIDAIVLGMAREIRAALDGLEPILMPILMGGAFTAVRLAQHLAFPYEMDSVRVARYGPSLSVGRLHWYARPCLELGGRHILLIDDVLDRGITLAAVEHELRRMNAASVSTAVLVRKCLDDSVDRPAVDYVGTDAPDRYLFGCGMDLDGRWRGLPALYALPGGVRPASGATM